MNAVGQRVLLLALALSLTGCAAGTDQAATRESVQDAADHATQYVLEVDADLKVDPLTVSDAWAECTRVWGADQPSTVTWVSQRDVTADAPGETASLLDPVLSELTDDGWTVGRDRTSDSGERRVLLARDSVTLTMRGYTAAADKSVAFVAISVTGPCVPPPAVADR